jgi:hypothetical protein
VRIPPRVYSRTMPTSHNSGPPHLIRMIDQHGQAVPLDVRQDGRVPSLVSPGKRTRFKIRVGALAYHVNRLVLPESPEDWHIYSIYVGSQLQFSSLADSPDEDGITGAAFSAAFHDSFFSFQIAQAAMDLVLERGLPRTCGGRSAVLLSPAVHSCLSKQCFEAT